jgi:hypothetical protein
MICSWYVHEGFNKRASFNLINNGECDSTLMAHCCFYELSLHTDTTTNISLNTCSLVCAFYTQNHLESCIPVM